MLLVANSRSDQPSLEGLDCLLIQFYSRFLRQQIEESGNEGINIHKMVSCHLLAKKLVILHPTSPWPIKLKSEFKSPFIMHIGPDVDLRLACLKCLQPVIHC